MCLICERFNPQLQEKKKEGRQTILSYQWKFGEARTFAYGSHIVGGTVSGVRNIEALPQSQIRCMLESWWAKFTSAEVCASNQRQASQHTRVEGPPVFIPNAGLPFTLTEGARVHSLFEWLKLRFRGGHQGRADRIESMHTKLNLVGVLKDKGVTHEVRILWFWGNWGLKWLIRNGSTKYIINPWAKGTLEKRYVWTMIILKLAICVLGHLMKIFC
jgi:hypothetical protein